MTRALTSARARGLCLALALAWPTDKLAAQGTIVYGSAQPPIFYGPLASSRDIDLNGDGFTDFTLASDGSAITLAPQNGNQLIAIPETPPDIGAFVAPLSLGASISSSLDPVYIWYDRAFDGIGAAGIVDCMNIGCIGYFQDDTDAYAGLKLNLGGSTYYGWLQIHNFGANFGQVIDWAYETRPDTPILVGAVPEPSTWALLETGGFLFWWYGRKKRRG